MYVVIYNINKVWTSNRRRIELWFHLFLPLTNNYNYLQLQSVTLYLALIPYSIISEIELCSSRVSIIVVGCFFKFEGGPRFGNFCARCDSGQLFLVLININMVQNLIITSALIPVEVLVLEILLILGSAINHACVAVTQTDSQKTNIRSDALFGSCILLLQTTIAPGYLELFNALREDRLTIMIAIA